MLRALAAVQDWDVRSLGLQIRNGKGPVGPRRQNPLHLMARDGGDAALASELPERSGFSYSDDVLIMATHGTTHLDALCHVWDNGLMYGGIPASEVTSRGAKRLGIDETGPILTRVLIVDGVPTGREWLEPGEPVSVDLMRSRLTSASLRPERGDALFVRTGWVEAWEAVEQDEFSWGGLDVDAIEWILESGIVLIGADNIGVEISPASDPNCAVPVHISLLRGRGIYFCELLNLAGYAGITRAGMLIISPLHIVGGTASPVAPVVVF